MAELLKALPARVDYLRSITRTDTPAIHREINREGKGGKEGRRAYVSVRKNKHTYKN